MGTSLGELYFSLGLDDKKFNNAITEAKKKIESLGGNVFENMDVSEIASKIQSELNKIDGKGKNVDLTVKINEGSLNQVNEQLAKLGHPVEVGVTLVYDVEKFQAVETTLKNYANNLNSIGNIKLGIDDSFLKSGISSSYEKGLKGFLSKASDYLLGDDSGDAAKSIKSIQKILDSHPFKIKVAYDHQALLDSMNKQTKKVKVKVDVDADEIQKKLKALKIPLGFNISQAINEVKTELKKKSFEAKLNLVIDRAKISKVIKEAFAKKGLEYQVSPSDVRNARILEIQQRMEHRQKRFNGEVDKSNKSMTRMLRTTKHVADWAGQLGNQFTNLISLYSVERFVRSLYTIGGEFQKQQIALSSMVGDAAKGEVLFERMKDLAVKSPFTFSELSSYTKQMAAYGIEYEELYDTTKRLADISAGVGVDMGRLILAYGQVRSAEVLRGQELRQFTEAGIPLVSELAKRLSEVRGESVKIGEVFDAISKRQVSFDMVKDVLFDMTDPGGRFFEMQEELAKSLAGQWSNLKDAWDIMIADIANSSNTVLSDAAGYFNDILRSWREWLPTLTMVAGAIGAVTSAIRVATTASAIWNTVSNANPWVKLASVILGAAGAIGGWVLGSKTAIKNTTQLNTELDEEIQKWNENRSNALRYVDTLKSANTSEERRLLLYKELVELYPELFENMKLETLMLKDIAGLKTDINDETTKKQLALIEKEIEDERLVVKYINDARKRKVASGAMVVRSLSKEEREKLKAAEKRIAELEDRKEKLQQGIDREGLIAKLTPDSELSKYIEVYRELGKAVKILRQGGIIGEITNPKELTTTLEYYDQLNTLLKEQNEIKEKFKPTTDEYKNADKLAKVYQNAIDAIGGVWKVNKNRRKTSVDEQAKRDAQAYVEELKRALSEESQKWNLYKQLFDATGNDELSRRIAYKDSMTFVSPYMEVLKKKLEEEAAKLKVGIGVDELLKMGEKGLMAETSIPELEREKVAKALGAIIKAYHDESKSWKAETIKDFVDIINASKDFAAQIEEVDRNLRKQLETLATIHGKGTPAYEQAAAEAIRKAEEKKTNINFEEFKKSSDWVKVFDDLDRVSNATLDNMASKIEEYARQANLSEEVTKQLVEAMAKLRKETIDRNPFEGFSKAMNSLKYYKSLNSKVGEYDEHGRLITQQMVDDGVAAANEDLKESALGVSSKLQAVGDAASMVSGIFNQLGVDVQGFTDAINSITSGAQSGANIASSFGKSGPYGAIAGAFIGLLSYSLSMQDKELQSEIEKSEAINKELSNVVKKLETTIERTMGGLFQFSLDQETRKELQEIYNAKDTVKKKVGRGSEKVYRYSEETRKKAEEAYWGDSYIDAQLALLLASRDEITKQIASEEAKGKDKSESKIADKKRELEDVKIQIEDLSKDLANSLYGVDFKGWANQLAQALVEAWSTGEDAVEAYNKTVTDILKNVGVSVITQKIMEEHLKPLMSQFIEQFTNDDGKLTDASMKILSGMYEGAEEAANATAAYLEGLKKLGVDISDKSSQSSGLSKSIQGVTENTADLLGSYINAIRSDVSVNRSLFEQLANVDVPKISYIAEAQLRELSQIQANTAKNVALVGEIRDLVNRVVDKGSNRLKV